MHDADNRYSFCVTLTIAKPTIRTCSWGRSSFGCMRYCGLSVVEMCPSRCRCRCVCRDVQYTNAHEPWLPTPVPTQVLMQSRPPFQPSDILHAYCCTVLRCPTVRVEASGFPTEATEYDCSSMYIHVDCYLMKPVEK